MDDEVETTLTGGNMSDVTRIGGEVRRPTGPWTANVHALLEQLQGAGIDGIPRVLGNMLDGRERLSFVEGDVAHYPLPEWLWNTEILVDAGRLLRRIHDASTEVARTKTGWRVPAREPVEVVCHNDFAPYNLVFEQQTLAGVIDFDMAAPGPRLWDLCYLAYRLIPYIEDAEPPRAVRDAESSRLATLLSAYGTDASAESVWELMAVRLDELAALSRAGSHARPELAIHAAMYDRDAARMRARAGSPRSESV